ncbi:MAG TPA: phenylalanine--tRNA ligase subunit beta [Segeticoccus sp.]|uniref:phenylalanine--tRNA ligase subunit beta n=1 Tax=Segeticoccus sp. TaxID=2706531 RepID=UPI002D7E3680|nr:phenylalanine--tRNA ligase subunit beta [Segeticoccus sp.]HET8600706.1 phenylalanine--tRNA ligase subunit beta [Segeticoccus sp.]
MRVPVSWLRDYVDVPADATAAQVAASLVRMGLEEEALHGGDIEGPLVVGRVLELTPEKQKNGKTINWCRVDVGENGQRLTDGTPQGIVCGAHNFAVGDLVVVVLPGAVLPGGFEISARKTYGHVSAGMICSAAELGIGDDHAGIIVLSELLGEQEAAKLQPGDDAIELLGLADQTVEVTITPDRGYCFSMRGVAREYSLATGAAYRDPADPADRPVPAPNDSGYAVRLADEAPLRGVPGCDRYVARVVRGVDAAARSPRWMAKRLTEAGMRPISLAVDVTNYVMLALGQPLHAFDLDTLSGEIVVRRARPGERLRTLDDVDRDLDPEDLLITDGGAVPLAIAGVMGGETSEVSATTTNVLIESAHFDPTTVARSSRRHKLATEASRRYERGVDPDVSAAAAQWAAELLVEHGGGRIDDGVTDVDHRAPREPVLFDPALASALVGIAFPREEVVASLKALGCDVAEAPAPHASEEPLVTVLPPPWRPDLTDGPDLVEEVARLHGYDEIPSVLPEAPGGRGLTHGQQVRRTAADLLAGAGLVEVVTYPFVSAGLFDQLGLPQDDVRRQAVRLANPLSEEAPLMRTSVVSTLLEALRRNVARGLKDVALFEVGLVCLPGGPVGAAPVPGVDRRPDEATLAAIHAAVPAQPRHIGLALTGLLEHKGWWGPGRPAQWSDAVDVVRRLAGELAVELTVTAVDHAPWHPGRCARLALPDGTQVGHAGELHPKVLSALGLPARTCAAEVDLEVLIAASDRPVSARPIVTSPPAHSDVALVVPSDVPAAAVEQALRDGAGELLEVVALFDVYEGDQVAEGHRSLAYRFTFRAPGRTLTTDEVNQLRDRAVAEAARRTGAELRGN